MGPQSGVNSLVLRGFSLSDKRRTPVGLAYGRFLAAKNYDASLRKGHGGQVHVVTEHLVIADTRKGLKGPDLIPFLCLLCDRHHTDENED